MAYKIRRTAAGVQVCPVATDKLGFHGAAPVAQRTGAAQAAVNNVGATYSQAEVNAIVALVNELRAALVQKGLIKGSA